MSTTKTKETPTHRPRSEKPNGERQKTGLFATMNKDLPASLVVFLVALPLSLGIALASGAPLLAGIISAAIGGIVVGALSGAPLMVSGPAAGLTVLVLGYVQQYGWRATCAITLAAGLIQLAMGAMGVAPLTMAIFPAVIHGMLAAIGILIALSQAHVVLGGTPDGKGLHNLMELPQAIAHLNPMTAALGLLTIGIMVSWDYLPKKVRAVPRALAAVLAATVISMVAGMHVPRVEFGGSLLSAIHLPVMPQGGVTDMVLAAAVLALVASAESLISAVATDKLHTGARANLHRELMAQGAGNTLAGLVGGLPITGVIVRSTANIGAGAKSRMSAILHGAWVLLFVALLSGLVQQVPLAVLAGLLVYTGIKLVDPKHIRELWKHGELPVYVVTTVAILCTHLLEGLTIGFALALFRTVWKLTHVDIHVTHQGHKWDVIIDGTLTFAGVPKLMDRLGRIPAGENVEFDLAVRFIDHAGYEALSSWRKSYERSGGTVQLEDLDHIWSRSQRQGKAAGRATTGTSPAPAEARL